MKRTYTLFVAGLMYASGIHAATITSVSADATRGGNIALSWQGKTTIDYAGFIDVVMDGIYNRYTFCADITTPISNTTYTTIFQSPSTIANGLRAAWLVENYAQTTTTVVGGQALQFAIWDIIHDGGDGLSKGNFRKASATTAAVVTQATSYLSLSLGHTSTNAMIYVNTNVSTGAPGQTLISWIPNDGGPQLTPEPASMLFVGAGLAGIAILARRKSKAPQVG